VIGIVPGNETSGRTLLYVHGHQCKPAVEDYSDLTFGALASGIERDHPEQLSNFHGARKRIAWYGDLSTELLKSVGKYFDEQLDLGDRRNVLQELRAIDRRKKFNLSSYDSLPGKSSIREFVADIAGPLLDTVGLSNRVLSSIARDLHEYWRPDSDYGDRVRERVRTAICEEFSERDREVMVISHGAGSIVVYDVLWQLSHDETHAEYSEFKVGNWMTLGAPLGDTTVRHRLFGAHERGRRRFPCNIVSWHNVSAEDDWLCHDQRLANDFKAMLRQQQVSAIRDYHIYNLAVRYGKSDPHCSLGYLIHPRVAKLMADWLAQPEPAPNPRYIF